MKKTNYFYIDESGHINNDSKFFIHGCIKTDSPKIISDALLKLKDEIFEDAYFEETIGIIKKQGFHATENHPDIRARMYSILPLLNYRAYFVIIDKTDDYFKNLKSTKEDYEIFSLSLRKLLADRVIKNKNHKNIFFFENLEIPKLSFKRVVKNLFDSFDSTIDCKFHIVNKAEENLVVVDYLNFVLANLLKNDKIQDRVIQNFNLIKQKIGVICILNKGVFLSRKGKNRKVELDNIIKSFGG